MNELSVITPRKRSAINREREDETKAFAKHTQNGAKKTMTYLFPSTMIGRNHETAIIKAHPTMEAATQSIRPVLWLEGMEVELFEISRK